MGNMPSLNPFKNRNNENDIQISPNDIIKEND